MSLRSQLCICSQRAVDGHDATLFSVGRMRIPGLGQGAGRPALLALWASIRERQTSWEYQWDVHLPHGVAQRWLPQSDELAGFTDFLNSGLWRDA
ncbi:MAG: hypothetical protein ABSG36_17825 [Acidimicrobiales bacterium]